MNETEETMKSQNSFSRLGLWGMCVAAAILYAVSNAFDNYIRRNSFGQEPNSLIATLAFLCLGAAIGTPIMFLRQAGSSNGLGVVARSVSAPTVTGLDFIVLAIGSLGAISTAAALHAHGFVDPSAHASASVAGAALMLVIYDSLRRRVSLGRGLAAVALVGAGSIAAAGVLERPLFGDLGIALVLVLVKAGFDSISQALQGQIMESKRMDAPRFVAVRFAGLAIAAIAGSFLFAAVTGQTDALVATIARYAPSATPLIVALMVVVNIAQTLSASALRTGTPSEVALLLASQPGWALLITFGLSFVAPGYFGIPALTPEAWAIRLVGVALLLAWPVVQRAWGINRRV